MLAGALDGRHSKGGTVEGALELSDDTLDGVSDGKNYTATDGYAINDGIDPEIAGKTRWYFK